MKYFSTSIRHSNQAGLPAQAGRITIGILTAIAMVVQMTGPVALLIPQTANAIVPPVFTESFGSGNDLADIPDWDEHEDGTIAKNPDGYIEDTASPDGGRFAKIAEDTNDSGSEDGWVCREINATGYESLELSYYWRGDKDSDDSSDDGLVQYKEGSGNCDGTADWNELKKHDIRDDSSWTFQDSFNLPNSLDDSVFRLRFYNDSATADNNEFFRVDGIEITGNVIEEDDKPGNGVGSIDNECQAYGFDFGIAKWEWNDEDEEYVLEDGYNEDYKTSVTGDASEADWTSDPAADGVLSKEGQSYQNLPGGTEGTVVKGEHDISHITLCGNEGEPEPEPICEIGVNLIENSGFETPVVTDGAKWDIFDSGTAGLGWLVNWMASVTDPAPDIAKLELHQGVNSWASKSGEQHAELDTDWQGPGGPSGEQASVAIYQDIPTVPGREYKLSFSFSPRPGTDSSENILGILWDGVLEDTVTAAGGGNTSWTDHEYTFVAADNSTKLEFQDQGTPNSIGTFLDDVSLECLPECNPAEMVVVSDSDMMVWRDIEDTPAVPLTFIHPAWTADVGDPSAQWVWEEDGVGNPEATEYYRFTKTFDIPGDVTDATLKLAADNYYKVWINDVLIGEEQNDENNFQLATQDTFVGIGNKLQAGSNTIKVEGKNKGVADSSESSNPAGILFALYINYKDCGGDEPPPPPEGSDVVVRIYKFLDGKHDYGGDFSWPEFNVHYSWYRTDGGLGNGGGDLTLGKTGWYLQTVNMKAPGNFSLYEETGDNNVVTSEEQCEPGKFLLNGYTYAYGENGEDWDAFDDAKDNELQSTLDSVHTEGDGIHVLVWNETCPLTPPCEAGPTWADEVIGSEQGNRKDGSDVLASRSNPGSVLGTPDGDGPNNTGFYSLGADGTITVKFDKFIENTDGNDLSFHEITNGRESYPEETAKVEVSQNGTDWQEIGAVSSKAVGGIGYLDFDSTGWSWIQYARVTDTTDFGSLSADADGYDLDAIDATNGLCEEPEPQPNPEPDTVSITVTKVLAGDLGDHEVSDFTLKLDTTEVVSGETNVVSPGTYTVSEEPADIDGMTASFSDDCNSEGIIEATTTGESYFCTITNTFANDDNNGDGDGDGNNNEQQTFSSSSGGGGHSGDFVRPLIAGAFSSGGPAGEVLGASTEFPGLPNTGRAEDASNSTAPTLFALILALGILASTSDRLSRKEA